jgi:hypothetical protein
MLAFGGFFLAPQGGKEPTINVTAEIVSLAATLQLLYSWLVTGDDEQAGNDTSLWYLGLRPRLLVRTCGTYRVQVMLRSISDARRHVELFAIDDLSNEGPVRIVLDSDAL